MRISDWSSDVCSSDLGAGNYDASNGIVVTAQTDEATRRFSGKTLKELQDEAYNAQQALFNLRTENDALKARLDGAAEIPATIGAAFNEAAPDFARMGGLNVSLRDRKSGVEGKGVSVRFGLGGGSNSK